MNVDSDYQTEVITNDMCDDEKLGRILIRVISLRAAADTLLSAETTLKIIGSDAYSELTMDAIALMEDGEKTTAFVRHELQERIFDTPKKKHWWQKRLSIKFR